MKEKKLYRNYNELSHAFFYNQTERCNVQTYNRSMLFHNDRIFSYGTHYCIAEKLKSDKQGKKDILFFNCYNYSNTTVRHKQAVRSAIPPHYIIFDVPDASTNREANIKYFFAQLRDNLFKASKARTRKRYYLAEAERFRLTILQYRSLFHCSRLSKEQKNILSSHIVSTELLAYIVQTENKLKQAKIRKLQTEKKQYIANEAQNIQNWIANTRNYLSRQIYDRKVYLRISANKQQIETSKGSDMDIDKAKRLYCIMQRVESCSEYDGYRMSYNSNHLQIGCHNIDRSEIERIAKLAGWRCK